MSYASQKLAETIMDRVTDRETEINGLGPLPDLVRVPRHGCGDTIQHAILSDFRSTYYRKQQVNISGIAGTLILQNAAWKLLTKRATQLTKQF